METNAETRDWGPVGAPSADVGGERRGTLRVEEAATGARLADVATASVADVDRAVERARAAQSEWFSVSSRERGRVLSEAARLIAKHGEEIAELETRENGKPLEQSRADVDAAAATFSYYGGLADKVSGSSISLETLNVQTVPEPYGVVGAVLPFNWPPVHVAGKAAPALAAGNAVVMKPAEQAPLSALRTVEIVNRVLPPGVLTALPGLGPTTGRALVSHPGIGKISFTGSTATGREVLKLAAENITPALVELGGKNPLLVFSDANIPDAVSWAIEGMFYNQGEACTAASRILVHESVKARFTSLFKEGVERLRVGDGLDASTDVGPLVTRAQQERVTSYIRIGLKEGAEIVARGSLPSDSRLRNGFFVEPVVFSDVNPDMRIAREEIFGPVSCVLSFSNYAEAIRIANSTDFGLAASVFSSNRQIVQEATHDLKSGVVMINNYYNRGFLGSPFGGTKASGYGREHGPETILEYVQLKNVREPAIRKTVPRWSGAVRARKKSDTDV